MFRVIPDALNFKEHVLLKNGQGILLRPASVADKPLIRKFLEGVSRESLRMRFMASVSHIPEETINSFCGGDFKEIGCLIAVVDEGEEEEVVGLGNYIGSPNGRSAEVAFLIQDKYQGRGIGTVLLERLAGLAAGQGFVEFEAEVLPENINMLNVFKSSGFEIHQAWGSETVHLEFPVEGLSGLWDRMGARERVAVANSLKSLLAPENVALIGASREEKSIGNRIFRHLIEGNFTGTVYPVNYEAESVSGVKAYSGISELPTDIDLAVVSVPAEQVCDVAEKAIHKGARGIIVVSAGFAEAGIEGAKRQKELVDIVRRHGVRLVGPSCLGVINTDPAVRLNSSLVPEIPYRGKAGFFSHSAALGIVALNYAQERGIGFTTFVSAGNRADVSGNDLLQFWEEDSDTKYAILYLETFGNPRRFVRIARRMSYKKPILCVKSARSAAGKKTVEAKSGNSVGTQAELNALFAQTGMIVTETLEELFDVAVILALQPLPNGKNVGIIANSAGMATLFADSGEANGLNIPADALIDLGAFALPESYRSAVENLLLNDEIDSLMIGFAGLGTIEPNEVLKNIQLGIIDAKNKNEIPKPIVLCFMGKYGTLSLGTSGEFPLFRFPEAAARALARVVNYKNFVNRGAGKLIWYEDVEAEKARGVIKYLIENEVQDDYIELNQKDSSEVLGYFGLIKSEIKEGSRFYLSVKPDPLFGPTIEIANSDKKGIVRITPLTDTDIIETLEELKLHSDHLLGEVMGRVSQFIEEIPWLWQLEALVIVNDSFYLPDFSVVVKSGGSKLPNY